MDLWHGRSHPLHHRRQHALGRHGLGAKASQDVHGASLLGEKLAMGITHLGVEVADLVDDLSAPGGRRRHHTHGRQHFWLGATQLGMCWHLGQGRGYRRRRCRLHW